MTLVKSIFTLKSALSKSIEEKLPGGWEEQFSESIERKDEKIHLKSIELTTENSSRANSNNNLNELRKSMMKSAVDFLDKRFNVKNDLIPIIEPFLSFKKSTDIHEIHRTFGSDLSLLSLTLQFNELVESLTDTSVFYLDFKQRKDFKEIITVIGRIHVCSPQSADIEHSFKANNLLKNIFRNRFSLETENK